MIKQLSSSVTKKKEAIQKWIRDRVDYSREAEHKPYTFHRDISFLDCQLPRVATLQPRLRNLYIRSVVDEDMKMDLENCHAINWLPQAIKLTPINVPRDGNCLLHAASMALWGAEDSRNTLRDLMLMTIKINQNFKNRWWCQLMKDLQSLNVNESTIIDQEWDDVIRSIGDLDSSVKSVAVPHRFLEGIHIYILANILRRPIIIVTNSRVRSLAGHDLQENNIGGLYLPLEWTPLECCKTPLVLGYSLNHFCPLLSETQSEYGTFQQEKDAYMFPLVTSDLGFLLVRYLKDEEELQAWDLVQTYLIVKEVETADAITRVPFAQMHFRPLEQRQNSLFEHLKMLKEMERLKEDDFLKDTRGYVYTPHSHAAQQSNHPFYDIEMNSQTEVVPMKQNHSGRPGVSRDTSHLHYQSQQQQNATSLCINEGCNKEGSDKLNNLCFRCYRTLSVANVSEDKNVSTLTSANTGNANEAHAIIPTAPPMSLEASSNDVPLLSMMSERCINGCGYRCSHQTYPYCHECSMLKTKDLEQNVIASAPVLVEPRSTEGAQNVSESEMYDIHCVFPVLSSSPSNSINNFSEFSSSESSWPPSGNLSHLFSFTSNESKQSPMSGLETLVDKNCKHFDRCSGVRMLDRDMCFSCVQNEKSVTNSSRSAETETQLPAPNRPGDRIMVIAEANAECSLEGVATSIAEANAECSLEGVATSFPEGTLGNMSADIEVSEEPTCKVGCPYCGTLIFPQDKLCSNCKDILQRGYKQKYECIQEMNQTALNAASKLQPETMKTSHGKNTQSVQEIKHSGKLSPNQETEGKLEDHNKGLEISHIISKLAQFQSVGSHPHFSQGKHCITAGCSNYGDPVMDNKCSTCYYESNPFAKPGSSLGVEKNIKQTVLYPTQDVNEKLSNKEFSQHRAYLHQTEQLYYPQRIKRPTPVQQPQYSSGAKTAPVKTNPSLSHGSPSKPLHFYSQRFEPFTSEPSVAQSILPYPEAKDVMVTSKTGHNSLTSLHPLLEHSSLQPLPEHSSYSFNPNPDKTFEKTFQAIEVKVKKNVKKCLSSHCQNYGSSYNKGYCNSCYKVIRKQRILEQEAKYGMDVPDS